MPGSRYSDAVAGIVLSVHVFIRFCFSYFHF